MVSNDILCSVHFIHIISVNINVKTETRLFWNIFLNSFELSLITEQWLLVLQAH